MDLLNGQKIETPTFKTSSVASTSKIVKVSGSVLAGACILISAYQYGSGQISGTEFTIDMIMTRVRFIGP